MPLYEYECDACGHRFEVIQKFSDALVAICPKCGGTVQKLPSSPAIQFKGSGWYITDYARAGKPDSGAPASNKSDGAAAGDGAKAEARSETKSDSSGDSKSEAKSDGKTASDTKSEAKPSSSTSS